VGGWGVGVGGWVFGLGVCGVGGWGAGGVGVYIVRLRPLLSEFFILVSHLMIPP